MDEKGGVTRGTNTTERQVKVADLVDRGDLGAAAGGPADWRLDADRILLAIAKGPERR